MTTSYVIRRSVGSATVATATLDPFQPVRRGTVQRYQYWLASPTHQDGGSWVDDQERATRGTHEQARGALTRLPNHRDGATTPEVAPYFPPMRPPSEWFNY